MKKIIAALLACLLTLGLSALSEESVFGVSERVSGLCDTCEIGNFVEHSYKGTNEYVERVEEEVLESIRKMNDMEQILYLGADQQDENVQEYVHAFLSKEHPENGGFAMPRYEVENCHILVARCDYPNGDFSSFYVFHSLDLPCREEIYAENAESASLSEAAIEWRQMGFSGESFYYGQTEADGDPEGFIVYESNQNCTYYGVNYGGRKDDLWDGTIIAVNRSGRFVDSINLITYENGMIRYSVRYFEDGSIVYCAFDNNIPDVRYDRDGDKTYRRNFMKFSNTWGPQFKVEADEVQPEWGLDYRDVEIHFTERRREDGLHIGKYLLTGVNGEGELVDILYLTASEDGSVEYTLNGETWRYDKALNKYKSIVR
jgi:hypothetical protein